jgi:hypothetical protein
MDSVPLSGVMPIAFFVAMLLVQAVAWVFLAALGAWLAIRFEKWREGRSSK